ncbi:hypothetical protein DFH07DRAFT_776925 [Mycena maculata]|uniref:Uncharacterized protein n=1 Tax=Mycena maculata TaxID=230809 RepID=A0AAD7ILN4_9AGAR|nr:hypothetical protein DFH07DRAFT_776925 [Mycena maculata]
MDVSSSSAGWSDSPSPSSTNFLQLRNVPGPSGSEYPSPVLGQHQLSLNRPSWNAMNPHGNVTYTKLLQSHSELEVRYVTLQDAYYTLAISIPQVFRYIPNPMGIIVPQSESDPVVMNTVLTHSFGTPLTKEISKDNYPNVQYWECSDYKQSDIATTSDTTSSKVDFLEHSDGTPFSKDEKDQVRKYAREAFQYLLLNGWAPLTWKVDLLATEVYSQWSRKRKDVIEKKKYEVERKLKRKLKDNDDDTEGAKRRRTTASDPDSTEPLSKSTRGKTVRKKNRRSSYQSSVSSTLLESLPIASTSRLSPLPVSSIAAEPGPIVSSLCLFPSPINSLSEPDVFESSIIDLNNLPASTTVHSNSEIATIVSPVIDSNTSLAPTSPHSNSEIVSTTEAPVPVIPTPETSSAPGPTSKLPTTTIVNPLQGLFGKPTMGWCLHAQDSDSVQSTTASPPSPTDSSADPIPSTSTALPIMSTSHLTSTSTEPSVPSAPSIPSTSTAPPISSTFGATAPVVGKTKPKAAHKPGTSDTAWNIFGREHMKIHKRDTRDQVNSQRGSGFMLPQPRVTAGPKTRGSAESTDDECRLNANTRMGRRRYGGHHVLDTHHHNDDNVDNDEQSSTNKNPNHPTNAQIDTAMTSQQPENSPEKKTSRTEAAKDAPSRLNPERSYASPNWDRRKLTGNRSTQEEGDDPFHAPASDRLMNLFLEVQEPPASRHRDHREIRNADNTVSPTRGLETGRDSTDVESLDERKPREIREGAHAGTTTPTEPPTPAHNGDHDSADKTPGKGKGRALDEHTPAIHPAVPTLEVEDPGPAAPTMDVPRAHTNAASGSGGADATLEGNPPPRKMPPQDRLAPPRTGRYPLRHTPQPRPQSQTRSLPQRLSEERTSPWATPLPDSTLYPTPANDAMEQDAPAPAPDAMEQDAPAPAPDGLAPHYGPEVIEAAQAAAAVQAAGGLPDPHPFAFDNVNQARQAQRDAAMEDIVHHGAPAANPPVHIGVIALPVPPAPQFAPLGDGDAPILPGLPSRNEMLSQPPTHRDLNPHGVLALDKMLENADPDVRQLILANPQEYLLLPFFNGGKEMFGRFMEDILEHVRTSLSDIAGPNDITPFDLGREDYEYGNGPSTYAPPFTVGVHVHNPAKREPIKALALVASNTDYAYSIEDPTVNRVESMLVAYARPATPIPSAWEPIANLIAATTFQSGYIKFYPALYPSDISGPRCVKCKRECHMVHGCPFVVARTGFWGPPDQISRLTSGKFARRGNRDGQAGNGGGRGRGRGNNANAPRGNNSDAHRGRGTSRGGNNHNGRGGNAGRGYRGRH